MWSIKLVVVGIIIVLYKTSTEIIPNEIKYQLSRIEDRNENVRVSECFQQITDKYISCKTTLFVISSNDNLNSIVRKFNERLCYTIITRSFRPQSVLLWPDVYVLSFDKSSEVSAGIQELRIDEGWNPKAKFIILIYDLNVAEIRKVFTTLLHYMIINVILLTKNSNNDLEIFTYFPYSNNYCGRNASDIRSLGYCGELNGTPLFPDKVPNDLRNCTFTVVTIDHPPHVVKVKKEFSQYLETGTEQYLMDALAESIGINLKYVFLEDSYGVIYPNRTGTGLLGSLLNDKADIIIGGMFILKNRIQIFDYIWGFSYERFSIFTPIIEEQTWKKVYKEFGVTTWSLIILSYIVTAVITLAIKSCTSRKVESKFLEMLKLWRYFYGQADDSFFKETFFRRIMIFWIFYTSFICAFYNTAYYSLITGNVKDKSDIDRDHIETLPYKPCISDNVRIFFLYGFNESLPKGDNIPGCNDHEKVFDIIVNRKDLYSVETGYMYYLRASLYLDSEGNHQLNEWYYSNTCVGAIYTTKGQPLVEKFQRYTNYIFEAGLLEKLLSVLVSKSPKLVPTEKKKYHVIRIQDFRIHYYILMIGSIVSLLCFIYECISKN